MDESKNVRDRWMLEPRRRGRAARAESLRPDPAAACRHRAAAECLGCLIRGGRRRPAGVGLLEVVITITILTSVMLATTLVLVPVARQSRINRETTIANAEARRVIERLLAIPFQDIVETYPDRSELEVENLPDGKLRVSYADPSTNPLEIHLELTWTSPDAGRMTFSFVTVRTD